MKITISLILLSISFICHSQTFKDSVSFRSDLWLIETMQEGIFTPPDTTSINWDIKKIKSCKIPIYLDVSKDGTLIGITSPKKMTLRSDGIPNNGFIKEKWFDRNQMLIQTNAKDESGYLWRVTCGKDAFFENENRKEDGRIYVVIEDPQHIRSSLYFTLKSFGSKK